MIYSQPDTFVSGYGVAQLEHDVGIHSGQICAKELSIINLMTDFTHNQLTADPTVLPCFEVHYPALIDLRDRFPDNLSN